MALSYNAPGYPQQAGYGLALAPARSLVPVAPTNALQAAAVQYPGISPVFDPHAFLPPMRPGEFEVQPLISISDLIGYIRRGWLLGALVGVLLGIMAFAYLGMGMKIYQAESQLLLRLQGDNPFAMEGMSGSILSDLSAPMLINNHRTEMTSRRYMEYFADHYPAQAVEAIAERESATLSRKDQLLKLVGLYKPGKPAPAREAFIDMLSASIAVEPLKESHVLRIQMRDRDPELAAEIANRYVELYIDYIADNEAQRSRDASAYLETESREALKRLREAEQKLAEYRKANGILEDVENKDVSNERVRQLNLALTEARVKLTRAENDSQALNGALQGGHGMLDVKLVADNLNVADLRKQLDAKNAQRASLTQLGRRHPTMVALNSEIENLQAALDKAVKSVVFMIQQEVQTQQRQVQDIETQLAVAQGTAVDAGGRNVQFTQLRDDVRTQREWYDKIEQRRSAASLTGKFKDSGLLRIADRAVAPEKPVKPNTMMAALASMMLFGFSLIGLPVSWGLFNDHVRKHLRANVAQPAEGEEEIAMRAAQWNPPPSSPPPDAPPPLMAPPQQQQPPTTPFSMAPPPAPAQSFYAPTMPRGTTLLKPAAGETPTIARLPYVHAGSPEAMLTQLLKPEPVGASGALHQLTATLERQAYSRGVTGGIILVTSAEPREGKTVVAAALAAAFCHQGRSVFMMECNPSSPALHEWFPRSHGEGAWAQDIEGLRYSHTNLFLLPGRDLPAHATNELLDGYRTWIERARTKVDWIILDASPLLKNFANVAPLAPLATDVLVVNNPVLTTPAKLRAAVALLQPMMSSSALRGMVMNAV
ncbi:MAG: hypothetical protein JNG86_13835 [Verrucomicrobiaceae bacterium]|nr:hypothetical protein [Verrucomicrobiaceae bacterium]